MLFLSVLTIPRGDAIVAREQQPFGSIRRNGGLAAGHEGQLAVLRIGQRLLQVVTDAEVQRHPRMNPEIILREHAEVGAAVDLADRRILAHGCRKSQKEIGVRIAGRARLAAVEGEEAVVVQQRVVDDLFVRDFAPELERVVSAAHAQAVLHREIVAAGIGACDRRLAGEEPGDGQARQRRVSLNRELRVQIAQRRRRPVDPGAELPRVREPHLVDHRRAQRPRVGHVEVVLRPREVAVDPRDGLRTRRWRSTSAACRCPSERNS